MVESRKRQIAEVWNRGDRRKVVPRFMRASRLKIQGRRSGIGSSCGFTLLEMVIVLILIGLLFGLSAFAIGRGIPSVRLNATAREISAAIRFTRTLALTKGESQTMTIEFETRKFGIKGRDSKSIPSDISVRVIDPVAGEVSRGVYRIVFRPSGGYEGAQIVLRAGGNEVRVNTDPILGSTTTKPGGS